MGDLMWRKASGKATCGMFEENRAVTRTRASSRGHALQGLVNISDFIALYSD